MRRQNLSFLMTLVVATTSGLGQAAQPTGSSSTIDTSSIPNFSGLWAHEFIGFEPPSSGHGPIRNLSRVPSGQADINRPAGDYSDPILKPEAAAILKAHGEISLSGNNFQQPANVCGPQPMPYVLWQQEIQLVPSRDHLDIHYMSDHQVRHVRLNSQHPAHVTPSWSGDSVGQFEGGTLVIDTVGVKATPSSIADYIGTPQSEAVHVIERYSLIDYAAGLDAWKIAEKENVLLTADRPIADGIAIDPDYRGKALQLEFMVEDPNVTTMPWSARSTYRKASGEWLERVCAENTAALHHIVNGPAIPTADKPDF
jgi:hypothetical protein